MKDGRGERNPVTIRDILSGITIDGNGNVGEKARLSRMCIKITGELDKLFPGEEARGIISRAADVLSGEKVMREYEGDALANSRREAGLGGDLGLQSTDKLEIGYLMLLVAAEVAADYVDRLRSNVPGENIGKPWSRIGRQWKNNSIQKEALNAGSTCLGFAKELETGLGGRAQVLRGAVSELVTEPFRLGREKDREEGNYSDLSPRFAGGADVAAKLALWRGRLAATRR